MPIVHIHYSHVSDKYTIGTIIRHDDVSADGNRYAVPELRL